MAKRSPKAKPPTIQGVEMIFEPTPSENQSFAPLDRETQRTDSGESKAVTAEDGSGREERSTTQAEPHTDGDGQGNVAIGSAVDSSSGVDSPAIILLASRAERLPGESRNACWERLRKMARAAGMPRGQGPGTAYFWADEQIARIFAKPEPIEEPAQAESLSTIVDIAPPLEAEPTAPTIVDIPAQPPADLGVSGLGDLPESWGQLPANAQLQTEIAWVTANRLKVRSGNGVDLSRALSPAPSYSALSWLETSILFPAKFADISVKATASQDDEREHIKREKMAIEEIRSILAEMLEG